MNWLSPMVLAGGRCLIAVALLGCVTVSRGQQTPTLEVPGFDSLGRLRLRLNGEAGTNYAIEVSRNLSLWLPLTSGTATNGQMEVRYSPATNTTALYFRARLDVKLAPVHVSVQTDTNNQTVTLITPEDGGTLSLFGVNGVIYTLTVPPQAVFESEIVTMKVVTNLGGLPFASGLIGGVIFTPADLQFVQPAQLRIQFPVEPRINPATVVTCGFDTDGSYLRLVPSLASTNGLVLPLLGLSGFGCSVATMQEIQQQAQRIVSDTNNPTAGAKPLVGRSKGAYYDSCYPAEKTRAVFVNKGLENALRPIQQETAAKIGEARQAQLLGVDTPSTEDLGLQTAADNFYNSELARYAEEIKTNCALATVIAGYAIGIQRQTELLGAPPVIPDTFLDFCSLLPECARKIDECCKTKGPSQQALVEIIGLARQAELLGCPLPDWSQYLQDCYPGWSGTIRYEDSFSNYQQPDPQVESDRQYLLTATFIATNLVGQPTGQGYYGVTGTVAGTAEGKDREHTLQDGNCCYCFTDTLRTAAVQTDATALFQLVWSVTNVPPPIQTGLLLSPDFATLVTLTSVPSKFTETDSSGSADCKEQILRISTSNGTDAFALASVYYNNSSGLTGTVTKVSGTYLTNWTGSDGTQYSRKITWDLRQSSPP